MSETRWQSVVDAWRVASAKYPDNIAVEDGLVRWTYHQLEERVDAWSARIVKLPETARNIALQMTHGAEAIAALFGILAAGRAAVPLDPTHPIARRVAQLLFCDATVLLCRRQDAAALLNAGWAGSVIGLEDIRREKFSAQISIEPGSIAYFQFTSGSSGGPKAVGALHRTAYCGVAYLQAMFAFTPTDRHALLSPLAVSASTIQILTVLASGATLCLFEARDASVAATAAWLKEQGITTIQTVPSLMRALAREAAGRNLWPSLRAVKLGGEPATARDARLFSTCAPPGAVLINGLGLTEAGFNVCWSTWRRGEDLDRELLPIGRPPANLEIAVESSPGIAASNGEVGEIVVRSPFLPDGYWRDPERTAQVYRELPGKPDWRELRTGDAGRWRSDGLLEYRGRLDDLVKIRGCGVAPAEVEAALLAIDGIMETAVVGRNEAGTVRLHAFVQLQSDTALKPEDLRQQLGRKLPRYMIPAEIHQVVSLSYLANGKVDRARLSQDDATVQFVGQISSEPVDPLRLQLLRLWQDALGSTEVDVHDDFFAIGGDSLAAATIFSGVEKFLGVSLPVSTLVHAPTIEKLAELIRKGDWSEKNLRLVALRLGGTRPPLYYIPGAGGEAIEFRHIARHLDADQPCFAFQPQGLDRHQPYLRTVEAIAARYLDTLREYQPNGPYHFCGCSFGGIVAFEMAQRLLAQGQEVGFLGLFDTYGGDYPRPRKNLSLRKKLRLGLRQLWSIGDKKLSWSILANGLAEWRQIKLIRMDLALGYRGLPRPYAERYLYLREAALAARRRYQFQPFFGKLHLFRAAQLRSDLYETDPLLGWGGVALGGIEVHDLPCQHAAMLIEPNVRVLTKKLASCLAEIATPASSETRSVVAA